MTRKAIHLLFGMLRVSMGLFFLVVGGLKALKLDELSEDIRRFDMVPAGWEWYLACLGVGMELVIGVCLVCKRLYVAAALAGCAMTACFVGIFVQAWARGLKLSCNCLGIEREATNYPFEVAWRVALLLLMLVLLWDAAKRKERMFKPVRFDFSEM